MNNSFVNLVVYSTSECRVISNNKQTTHCAWYYLKKKNGFGGYHYSKCGVNDWFLDPTNWLHNKFGSSAIVSLITKPC